MAEQRLILDRIGADFYRRLVLSLDVAATRLREQSSEIYSNNDEYAWHLEEAARLLKELESLKIYGRVIGYFVEFPEDAALKRIELRVYRFDSSGDRAESDDQR